MCCDLKNRLFAYGSGLAIALVAIAFSIPGLLNAEQTNGTNSQTSSANAQKTQETKVDQNKLLRHVVLFQFKETSSQEEIKKVVDAFRELPTKISVIADFEWGTNNSPEGLADGLTHGFIITFKSEKDRDTYLSHAAHQAFVEVLKPHLQKPLVIDFWASK